MKKTTFTLLLSLSCCWMAAQCPADITFSTQGQIDSFQINYPNCIEIDSNVIISGNDIVRLDSLYSLKKIGGQLRIEYTGLSDLTGLNNLDSLYGLEVYDNPQLNSLNVLENIHSIRNDVRIILNPSLKSLSGLDNLQNIRGLLGIYSNDSLATLNGLENLDSLGKCLDISSNPMLVSLDGLNGLRFIGGCKQYPASTWRHLEISYNLALTSIKGLDMVNILWSGNPLKVNIEDCPGLFECEIQSVCQHIANGSPTTISGNAPGCNSVAEIEAACIVSIEETSEGEPVVVFSPNPASDFLQIQISDLKEWDLSLFNLQGRQMFHQTISGSQTLSLKAWPSGLYTLRAVSGERVFSGKIVKQ